MASMHHHQGRTRRDDGQLPLDDQQLAAGPSGLPDMTGREAMNAELSVLGIDVVLAALRHHRHVQEVAEVLAT
ncbi:hypothetical protein IPZ58_30835 [Streptomyces roseoverticillatus]|uniref:hypothetical protein n=1 Tax=Streptomyces roseoverticillatus TaxID=66429 RepID=UPI001F17801D|nr:hypothetical protein [Streptomyces roseoverticillatus]MCF3105940.1 hypothetical protein [Streptomyces roseoverticillatus]